MYHLSDLVTVDKEISGGTPVFKGTRVAVKTLFDYLEEGSIDEFLKGFPSVTRKQAEAVIELAAAKLLSEIAYSGYNPCSDSLINGEHFLNHNS